MDELERQIQRFIEACDRLCVDLDKEIEDIIKALEEEEEV